MAGCLTMCLITVFMSSFYTVLSMSHFQEGLINQALLK